MFCFYILTIQYVTSAGMVKTATRQGLINVSGVSREFVLTQLTREIREFNNVTGDHVVLFFSLEPNELRS